MAEEEAVDYKKLLKETLKYILDSEGLIHINQWTFKSLDNREYFTLNALYEEILEENEQLKGGSD